MAQTIGKPHKLNYAEWLLGSTTQDNSNSNSYSCSELAASLFCHLGLLDCAVKKPAQYAPGDFESVDLLGDAFFSEEMTLEF